MTLGAVIKWLAWPVGLALVGLLSLRFGVTESSWSDVFASLACGPGEQAMIVTTYRLPRVVAGCVVGAHFGIAGLLMQIVLRNPLADPTIFGVSGGASLAVVAAMVVSVAIEPPTGSVTAGMTFIPMSWVPHIALIGAMAAMGVVFWLSWDRGFSPARMTLNGVIVGAILNAFVMALVLSLSESRTELAVLWLAGSLYARSFEHIWPVLPWTVVGLGLVFANTRVLSLLRFDAASAMSMGLRVGRSQLFLVVVAVVLAASAVSIAGPVGFVGLLVPHIARMSGARSVRYQIWVAIFTGAVLVTMADMIGRILAPPRELPVGIVTSLIGAPVFAWILNHGLRKDG